MAIEYLIPALALGKAAFDALKEALPLVRSKKGKELEKAIEQAEKAFEQAEIAFKIAEGKTAKELGYQLCKRHFPPVIMLSTGYAQYGENFKCPECGNEWRDDDEEPYG